MSFTASPLCKAVVFLSLLTVCHAENLGQGDGLSGSSPKFIWSEQSLPETPTLHAGFRRDFDLTDKPEHAHLKVFAYTRYELFVNGAYVGRGPNRFENRRPEYDSWDLSRVLRAGHNSVAVLVHRDWTGIRSPLATIQTYSRFRFHLPGVWGRIECTDRRGASTVIPTDASWKAFREGGFLDPGQRSYSSIPERYDARLSPGAWTSADFDPRSLPQARVIDASDRSEWPEPVERSIPLLREKDEPFKVDGGGPDRVLKGGESFVLRCPKIVQAYWRVDLNAQAGTVVSCTPLLPTGRRGPVSRYLCKEGMQQWIASDTFALDALEVRVDSGSVAVLQAKLVSVNYPFDRIGSFSSSDPALDKIWDLTARSLELLSEDAYTDCADRERSEWMDNDPPMYDATRVMMAGPAEGGKPRWSDPRLFAETLRRVALTQEPDGMLRARTCSDLVDIHTRMEDRACDWVSGLRKYYDATGDSDLVRELWPECERLLGWFSEHRGADGLVRAREWVAWDNPLSYATCEGAANNAFIQRAFEDAAYLSREVGLGSPGLLSRKADDLRDAFNQLLWDDKAGAYCSAVGQAEVLPGDRMFKKSVTVKSEGGRMQPTLHANLFALDRGLVPASRRARVVTWVLAHEGEIKQIMACDYYFRLLYSLDEERFDERVLSRIRSGWQPMVESPWGTTWEMTDPAKGSKLHCYGIVAGEILSTYVLGVRRDSPVGRHEIIIEPHLADLARAEGVVVTEFGPVPVSWSRQGDALQFRVSIPEGTKAFLSLPRRAEGAPFSVDGADVRPAEHGRRGVVELLPGAHSGHN